MRSYHFSGDERLVMCWQATCCQVFWVAERWRILKDKETALQVQRKNYSPKMRAKTVVGTNLRWKATPVWHYWILPWLWLRLALCHHTWQRISAILLCGRSSGLWDHFRCPSVRSWCSSTNITTLPLHDGSWDSPAAIRMKMQVQGWITQSCPKDAQVETHVLNF